MKFTKETARNEENLPYLLTLFDFEASTRDEAITVYTRAGGKSIDRLAPCSSMNLQAIAVPREPARKFSMTFERHKPLTKVPL